MDNPTISMIVAMGEDHAIGKNKGMLWHLPDDFKHFKKTTIGHPIIMGRKTFESLGGALPKRLNIVVTRQKDYQPEGAEVVSSLKDALELARKKDDQEIFIAGGGELYKQGLELTSRLYLTLVHGEFPDADTYFPDFDKSDWEEERRAYHPADERHNFTFTILFLSRKK